MTAKLKRGITKVKDPGSALTHFIAMILAIIAAIPLLSKAGHDSGHMRISALAIFILSMIGLYAASTIYHTLDISPKINKLLRKIDHMMIFILIAGTYTPVCMIVLGGVKAAYRGIGSIDFFAVARSVLLVARVAEQKNIRVLAQIKSNLAEEGQPIAFERRKDEFRYMGAYDITIDELLGGYCKTNKIQQAKQLIKGLYGKNVLISSADMEQKAEAIGVSKRTLDMAKKELNIKSKRQGSSWYWDLDNS